MSASLSNKGTANWSDFKGTSDKSLTASVANLNVKATS